MGTPVTGQEHLPWALLQKITFSICVIHLKLKLLSSVESPHLTSAIGSITKPFLFCPPHIILALLKPH